MLRCLIIDSVETCILECGIRVGCVHPSPPATLANPCGYATEPDAGLGEAVKLAPGVLDIGHEAVHELVRLAGVIGVLVRIAQQLRSGVVARAR